MGLGVWGGPGSVEWAWECGEDLGVWGGPGSVEWAWECRVGLGACIT